MDLIARDVAALWRISDENRDGQLFGPIARFLPHRLNSSEALASPRRKASIEDGSLSSSIVARLGFRRSMSISTVRVSSRLARLKARLSARKDLPHPGVGDVIATDFQPF